MTQYWKLPAVATVVFLLAAGDALARPGGGGARRGGGANAGRAGGYRSGSPARAHRGQAPRPQTGPTNAQRPNAQRPGAAGRPGSQTGHPTGTAAGNRAATYAGSRPGARAGYSARPGAARNGRPGNQPSATNFRQRLSNYNGTGGGIGGGANGPANATGVGGGNGGAAHHLGKHVHKALHHHWSLHPNQHPFTKGWYARHPGVWRVAAPWVVPTWAATAAWVGVTQQPVAYAYPTYSSVVYNDPASDDAARLAGAGGNPAPDADWMELGVFALMPDGQAQPNAMVQMSISKEGAIKGTYYDVLTDTTQSLSGSLDTKTQKVAWTLESNKSVIYEAGLQTLTEDQGAMLVHFGGNRTQKWTMVRVEEEVS